MMAEESIDQEVVRRICTAPAKVASTYIARANRATLEAVVAALDRTPFNPAVSHQSAIPHLARRKMLDARLCRLRSQTKEGE